MTLLGTIKNLELVASAQPAVKMVVENDIFRLNTYADAKYGVFAFTQGQHSASVDGSLMSYSFSLFYVDRLLNDRSNQIEVQSVGVQTIDNIIKSLEARGIFCDTSYAFTTFNQRFLDECAGVFCSVTFSVPAATCAEDYASGDTWYLKDADGNYFIDLDGKKIILLH